jgi:hypothetical protein
MQVLKFGRTIDVDFVGGQLKDNAGRVLGQLGDGVTFLPDPPPPAQTFEYKDLLGRGVPKPGKGWKKIDIQRFCDMVGVSYKGDDTIAKLLELL